MRISDWSSDVCSSDLPILFGLSFGGFVAQAAATRHPGLPSRLILASTACRSVFERKYQAFGAIGGPDARRAAERFWGGAIDREPGVGEDWDRHCRPVYKTTPPDQGIGRAAGRESVGQYGYI